MANVRSSLPSRLRQLLSTEGSISPSFKLDSEPSPKVKAFIDKVIQCPLQDIAIPLSGFHWEYAKGNFHHWRPLFHHFDTYFKTYISSRNDLLLSGNILDDSPFPKQAVLQILRVMQLILENCPNKGSFSGLEHFKLLLASTDPEILIASLETLSALVKINPSKLHAPGKLIGCGAVNSCLLSLAQGWGSKEEGLGLYSCITANERTPNDGLSLFPPEVHGDTDKTLLGSTLYYEMRGASTEPPDSSSVFPSTSVIHIPDLHLRKEDDLSIMSWCLNQHSVPLDHRFSLLTRIRYAHAFRSASVCRIYSKICLLSFIVLVQASDSHDELVAFFANEPEYTNELIRIVKSEDIVSGAIRTLAMNALGAQLAAYSSAHERARILSGSSTSFVGGNRMILLNVLQRAIASLNSSNDPSCVAFVEALLKFYLLHVLSSSSSGSVIRGSGMVPSFLPLLEDIDPTHLHLVCLAVKTLQKLMDYSNAALTLFKDLGGVELLAHRLEIEVHRVIDLVGTDDNSMVVGECSRRSDQLGSQKRLIRALLKALGSATYAPANSTRSQNAYDLSLPATLSLIFGNVDKFGGDIYSAGVRVMSEIIHKEPTCFAALYELGLPTAFLSSVVAGIVPSSKALTCVPNGIGAICLNVKGLEAVRETSALRFLVDIFTDKKYVVAMNDGIVPLANAVEELLRHVSTLRGTGVELIIEIINKIASLVDTKFAEPHENISGSAQMDTDSEDKQNMSPCNLVDTTGSTVEGITDEQFIQLSIFHVMVLVHRTMENAETCRLFVEKSGIEALLKLLLRPSIAQSSEGMSIALHSTMVFKSFTQHHSTALARAFCSSLKDYLKKALTAFRAVPGSFLLDPRETPDSGIFSSLFVVEFLLFLAASKDTRWVTALLTEFGNGSKDVLLDIGNIHREVLWQIALLEDSKVVIQDDDTGSADETQQLEFEAMADTEEQRLNSFRHLLDPLLRRRMSGWSFESQFLDLMNLYRDLTRASGLQQRQAEGSSNLRQGVRDHQSEQPESTVGPGSSGRKDEERRKSYYASCCDMVRSLSVHITHLFQELGKVMLVPSRRRDEVLNVSPASKSVASTFASIALEHMNFAGHANPSMPEVSVSSKCRYFGKVIDFIDGIILDKLDSCNPVLLNCMYGRGVIQSILTTFEATSQLLFAVNRSPASPMETDDGVPKQDRTEDADHSWIYGPLASYGKLMDHLATSAFLLSPFTKHLFTQPLISGDLPFPRDAEAFVKVLQSMILKAVLPVWTHQQFTECNYELIASVISIIRHIYTGVEVKNIPSNVTRITGPPPSESTISTIVEMGFSRPRAEEALRQVGSNSVELAMEWLFSHPEEVQEDDELARALAMSLGNSSSATITAEVPNESSQTIEEEAVQLPPIDDLLSTCRKLLRMKDSLAFPVRSLLVMLCSQNEGQHRSHVMSFIIDQVKLCCELPDSSKDTFLYSLFHVLALILNEDSSAREVAANNGFVGVASDLLSHWNSTSVGQETDQVPKWVTAAFVALDRLAQVGPKSSIDVSELIKKDDAAVSQTSLVIDEDRQSKLEEKLGSSPKHLDVQEQKRLVAIACDCIRRHLPSEAMHAVLQLCSTLTRNHSVAVNFLDSGGLHSLLSLPTSSLFVGFDSIAASIVRHILEDAQTLQQAMEAEIRHSFVTASNRQSTGRLTPRNFLTSMNSVVQRDPVIFLKAAQTVCQIEMVGERPYIVLLKDRDKEKAKERDKDKEKSDIGHGKNLDASATKNLKTYRKPPHSFIDVIELLMESVLLFDPPDESTVKDTSLPADMDIDVAASKGKGKAVVSSPLKDESSDQESSASMAKNTFILKIMTEILSMYASSVHILLRKDAEYGSHRVASQRGLTSSNGGIFHHVLHKLLPYSKSVRKEKKPDVDWRQKLANRASQFLVAACVRSAEARKRIFADTCFVLNDFVESSKGFRIPATEVHAVVDLLNDVLTARTPTGSYISAEASVTFVDVGLVRALNQVLHVLDLDHVDSHKVATGIVKVLELVTKEHVHAAELNAGRDASKPPTNDQLTETEGGASMSQTGESNSQANPNVFSVNNIESFGTAQGGDGFELAPDDMEHDQDTDGGFDAPEDDYMHETSEDARGDEFGNESVTLEFEIQPNAQENLDEEEEEDEDDEDEDDQMSGDEGDEVDEEDDEHNALEEDEGHHLPLVGTDQDDHEIDEDEYDEEPMDEEEDDEDEEDGVVLRLGDGMNGMNVFDHIEVLGRENSFTGETLHVMPVEVFGSRRQGRTTSIYNLLGRSSGDSSAPSQHPFLVESSSSSQTENGRDAFQVRNSERSSHLDSYFQTLRTGRHAHRLNLWAIDNHQTGGSSIASLSPSLEDLLVSHLRRPSPEKPSDNSNVVASQDKEEVNPAAGLSGMVTETPAESNGVNTSLEMALPSSTMLNSSVIADILPVASESTLGAVVSSGPPQSVEMQFEHNDAVDRDVEAVSQESSGSGATLGESLRSLDVEIGSADGHDDGGGRQAPGDDRTRRNSVLFGLGASVNGRDAALHSVTEVSENPSQEPAQGAATEAQPAGDADSGSIDPAFLEALPEELRAEVLSAQQGQASQPQNAEEQNTGDIDPEFLAALPPDIREEVLAQQRAQRVHQSHELEGQPVEMDTVSIIATFPSELREEVLLTSSDAVLSNLTPALVAEANMLRERFARRYNRSLFGTYPRNRRGESSRRGEGADRTSGGILARRLAGSKPIEAVGTPLVDTEDLKAMIRLLRIVQPLYKGHLQKLLLNLCAHGETRIALVKILIDLLLLDTRKPGQLLHSTDPIYRLYACQSNVTYSRPRYVDGVPPLVTRRVLEILTYLARNHPSVAKMLLESGLPQPVTQHESVNPDEKGKSIMLFEAEELQQQQIDHVALDLLLSLLNQPLYLRSISHLEQLLNLLDVIIDNAESKPISSDSGVPSGSEQLPNSTDGGVPSGPELLPASHVFPSDTEVNATSSTPAAEVNDASNSPSLAEEQKGGALRVLLELPQAELRLLCSLLAKDGLSDNVYTLVAEVVKKLVAIAPIHCHLFITELAHAVRSLIKSAIGELRMFGEVQKALLNTTTPDGAAVLRVLQALSSLVTALNEKDRHNLSETEYTQAVSLVSDINAALEPLWLELSICISKMESYSESAPDLLPSSSHKPSGNTPLPAGSQNILPYIESFFVMCEKLHTEEGAVADVEATSSPSTSQVKAVVGPVGKTDGKQMAFMKFSEKHKKLLNAFIRQNPGLLEKSFSLMLKVPRFIDFDNKRAHFRSKIKHQHDHHHNPLRISVRRAYILEDSYNQLRMRTAQELKGRLTVHFQGEEGIDAGGLTREWYQVLSRVVFDKGALLFTTVGNESTFQPNPNSVYQTEHLSYFKFVGRVVGKALFDGQLLDVHFTRSFYKHILGAKVTYHDIEAIDPDYFKNLKWLLENDISDILDLTFSIDADEEKLILYERNEVTDYELIPGGRNIRVTEENKHQYVDLVAEHRLTTAIRPQINAFLEGFGELIPRDLISIFNDKELELLISGLPDIDLDDLRANTEYSGYSNASPVIQWFWEVVQSLSKEDKARLLQFVTGTSKVPLEGFSALQGISGSQKFQIHRAYGGPGHLPSAHTCFNQLDLPEYPSKEQLEERLLLAIHEANEGFGFG